MKNPMAKTTFVFMMALVAIAIAAALVACQVQGPISSGGEQDVGLEARDVPEEGGAAEAPESSSGNGAALVGAGMAETPEGFFVPAHELYVEAGDGVSREQLEELIRNLGCENRGFFGGSDDKYLSDVPLTAYVVTPEDTPIWKVRERFLESDAVADCRYLQEVDASAMDDATWDSTVVTPDGKVVYRGRLDVVAADGVDAEELQAAIEGLGCSVKRLRGGVEDSVMPEGFPCYATVAVPDGRNLWDVREDFLALPEIASCSYQIYYPDAISFGENVDEPGPDPDEPGNPSAVLGEDCYQYYLNLSGFVDAWDTVTCDGDVSIGIIDTGIAFTDAELADNVDTENMMNAVTGVTGLSALMTDEAPWPAGGDPESDSGGDGTFRHGTSVAAVAAAVADGEGCDGASHDATLIPVKFCTAQQNLSIADQVDAIIDGYEHLAELDDAPAAIEMSFTISSGFMLQQENLVRYLQFASLIAQARSRGTVTVAAAGNDGDGANGRHYPACYPLVVSVGALAYPPLSFDPETDLAELAGFSNSASDVDICAFGESLGTIRAYGTGANHYRSASGTSFAVPQVASAIALVRALHPSWSADMVEAAVLETATAADGFVDANGDGIDDSGSFGHGALDVAAAVVWVPPSSGGSGSGSGSGSGTSPFTGPSDGAELDALQASYQEGLQRTPPEGIPGALERAMRLNPDVAAWLYVPGTSVSVPVALGGDGFYLSHDSLGNESAVGCAFTTSPDRGFGDAVTVVYGHSFASGGLAFTSLHEFGNYPFFAGHEEAFLYLPGRRVEYRVVGAYLFNARAIEDVDQSDAADLSSYFDDLCNLDPDSFVGYKRRVSLDPARDRVLQLSTCTVPADPARRFVVTCVRVGEEGL